MKFLLIMPNIWYALLTFSSICSSNLSLESNTTPRSFIVCTLSIIWPDIVYVLKISLFFPIDTVLHFLTFKAYDDDDDEIFKDREGKKCHCQHLPRFFRLVFTARRYASTVYAVFVCLCVRLSVPPFVCLLVCLSVTEAVYFTINKTRQRDLLPVTNY